MRHWMCALLLSALIPAAAVGQKPSELTTFTNVEGQFTVRMPGTPKEEPRAKQADGTASQTHTFVLAVKDSAYFVAYTDFPAEQIASKDAATLLAAARDGAIGNVKGRLVSEKQITVSGYPGLDLIASLSLDSRPGSAHIYLVLARARLYSALYVGTGDSASGAPVTAFLKSFQILGAEPQDDWKSFASEEGRFSIRLPGIPVEQATDKGATTVHQFFLDKGDYAYIVAWSGIGDVPEAASVPGLLAKGRNSILATGHGKLLEEKSISLGDWPGKYIRVTMPSTKGVAEVRSYVVGDRYYQVMLIGSPKALESAKSDRYFSSFHVDAHKVSRDWRPFASKEGRFSIDLPGEPKQETLKDNVTKFTAPFGETQFVVVYVDMPGAIDDPDRITKQLQALRDVELKAVNGTATSQKRITLGDAPGLQFNWKSTAAAGGARGFERIYLVGKRVFEVVAVTGNAHDDETSFARFFSSFKPQAP